MISLEIGHLFPKQLLLLKRLLFSLILFYHVLVGEIVIEIYFRYTNLITMHNYTFIFQTSDQIIGCKPETGISQDLVEGWSLTELWLFTLPQVAVAILF